MPESWCAIETATYRMINRLQRFQSCCPQKAHRRVAFSLRKCHFVLTSRWHGNSGTALGSAVGALSSAGGLNGTHDYAPFGELFNGNNISDPYKFTGKERGAETGNDYFGARYYASSMGLFLSPDWSAKVEPVPYAKLDNPQSLNLYTYVFNNPVTGVDLDGHQDQASEAATDAENAPTYPRV